MKLIYIIVLYKYIDLAYLFSKQPSIMYRVIHKKASRVRSNKYCNIWKQ